MNIPEEVIDAAAHAIIDAKYPGIAWGLIHGSSRALKIRQAAAAAEVVAEWARKEALREAAALVGDAKHVRDLGTATSALRALAEGRHQRQGAPDGQQ